MSSGTILSVSDSFHINTASVPVTSPMKGQNVNPSYPTGSDSFSLQAGQQAGQHYHLGDSFSDGSVGMTNSVSHLDGHFHGTQGISGSAQPQNMLGSVQQDVIGNADVSAQARMSTDSYPPSQNVSDPLQPSDSALNTIIKSPVNAPVQSPEGQMPAGTFMRQNSSFGSVESASSVVGSQMGNSPQNPLSSPSPNTSNQILTNQMTSTIQQGNSAFTQTQLIQGTNTAVSQSGSTLTQSGN